MVFHANIAWAAAPGDVFRIIFTASEKQFRFCRLFVLLVKGQTIWTHLCAMACRRRNSKIFNYWKKSSILVPIYYGGVNRCSQRIRPPRHSPYQKSFAALQSRFRRGCFVLLERRTSCQEHQISNHHHPRRKTVPDDQQNHEKE